MKVQSPQGLNQSLINNQEHHQASNIKEFVRNHKALSIGISLIITVLLALVIYLLVHIESINQKLGDTTAQLPRLHTQISELTSQVLAQNNEISQLQGKQSDLDSQISAQKHLITELTTKSDNDTLTIKEQNSIIRQLETSVQQYLNENTGLTYAVKLTNSLGDFSSTDFLQIPYTPAGDAWVQGFSLLPFNNLNTLVLAGDQITDLGLEYLSRSQVPNLFWLDLEWNNFTDEGMKSVASMNISLGHFSIDHNKISAKGIKYLANMNMKGMITLILSNNRLGDEGVELVSKFEMPYLERLYLNSNNITDSGCYAIANMNSSVLEYLELANNSITAQGVASLATMDLHLLQNLDLLYNQIGDQGMAILETLVLPELNFIRVSVNNITKIHKLQRQNLPKIRRIDVGGNELDQESIDYLNQNFSGIVNFVQ